MFRGFDRRMPDFLARLSGDENTELPASEEAAFQALCLSPLVSLIDAMLPLLNAYRPAHKVGLNKLTDARSVFAAGKPQGARLSPFMHIPMPVTGLPDPAPALHIVLSAGGFGVGAGLAQFGDTQQERFNSAIADDTAHLSLLSALETAEEAGCFLENLQNRQTVRLSRDGHDALQNLDGLVVRNRNEAYDDAVFEPVFVDWLDARLRLLLPLENWLVKHVC